MAYNTQGVRGYPVEINIVYREDLLKGKTLPQVLDSWYGKSKSWAVVIGINNYAKESGYPQLPYAINDAEAVRDYLIKHLGFSAERTIYLKDATKKMIEKTLGDILPEKVKKGDRVFVFFSGHGDTRNAINQNKLGYLIPIDGNSRAVHSTAISMRQIIDYSELIPAKQILFVIDACYSGIAGIVNKNKKVLKKETRKQVEAFIRSNGRQIMTAGTSDERVAMSQKWDNHSVFTYYFLKGLKGKADYNADGVITARELENYLDATVPVDSDQTPQLFNIGKTEGEFVFYHEGDL